MKRIQPILRASMVLALIFLTGCAASNETRVDALESELRQSRRQLAEMEQQVDMTTRERSQYEAQLREQERLLAEARESALAAEANNNAIPMQSAGLPMGAGGMDLLPPDAQPGQCYARVYVPPQYENRSERVMRKEASERIEVIPAQYTTVSERVLVRESGEKIEIVGEDGRPLTGSERPEIRTLNDGTIEVIPRAFETTTERVMVKEASERLEAIDAQYESVTERILVRPERKVWKPSRGRIYGTALRNDNGELVTRVDHSSGELMCLVVEPAEYKTVTKRVLRSAATTRSVAVPAEYKTITKRIPKKVYVRTVPLNPEYETLSKRVLQSAATTRRIEIPAEYETVQQTVQVKDERLMWMPVLCDVNVTSVTIRQIQQALRARGYEPGSVDGVMGQQTLRALDRFQQDNGLGRGELTLEALEALGIGLEI